MLWADCCRWPRSNNGERALLLSRSCSSSSRGRSRLGIEPRSVDRLVAHRTVRASVGTYGLLEDDTLASVGALPLRFDTVVASRLLLVAFDTPLSTSLVICQTLSASLYSNQLCRVLQRGLGLRKKKKKGGRTYSNIPSSYASLRQPFGSRHLPHCPHHSPVPSPVWVHLHRNALPRPAQWWNPCSVRPRTLLSNRAGTRPGRLGLAGPLSCCSSSRG